MPSILTLRKFGIIIRSIQEEFQGITDEEVLHIATINNYIILTFDRDYGELIFRYQPYNPPAVIYFREKGQEPLFASKVLLLLLQNQSIHFENAFTVIEKENIRQRFYNK